MTDGTEEPQIASRIAIIGTIMALVVAALFFWDRLPLEEKPNPTTDTALQIRLLILAIMTYADDHEAYPADLQELKDGYLDDPSLLFWVHPKTGKRTPWLYNPGLSTASYSRTPWIAQPLPWEGKRVIGYSGGQVIAQYEEDLEVPFQWPPTMPNRVQETAEPPNAEP